MPPNSDDFDADRIKARGRAGPHTAPHMFMPPAPSMPGDPHSMYYMPPPYNPWLAYAPPPLAYSSGYMPQTPSRRQYRTPPTSPLPPRAEEIHQFLVALLAKRDVDLLSCEAALTAQDFTPDILPDVTLARLIEVTGAVEGRVMKMRQFAKEWVARQQEKRKVSM